MLDKRVLREEMTHRIKAIPEDERVVLDAQIATQLMQLAAWDRAGIVLAYLAMEDEVNLEAILRSAIAAGKKVGLPRIDSGSRDMRFKCVSSIGVDTGELERHRYGFLQPSQGASDAFVARVDPSASDAPMAPKAPMSEDTLVLVPGRAFDRQGYRLGRGGGFYDRFLGSLDRSIVTVGVGYACQMISGFPLERWDVPVHIVVTDRESCFCHRET